MRFLAFSVLVSSLLAPLSEALSDNANQILAHQTPISQALHANKYAIDRYKGGLWGAAELGVRNCDTWGSLRSANANLNKSKLSSEDSEAITQNLNTLIDESIDIMNAFAQKAALVHQARVAYVVPIFLEAFYKESNDYRTAIETMVTEEYVTALQHIGNTWTTAWDACFDKYTSMGNMSDFAQDYKPFYNGVLPVMNLLW